MKTINVDEQTLKRFRGYKLTTQYINKSELTDDEALNALLDLSNNADIHVTSCAQRVEPCKEEKK
jgi:hypothetical protein